MLLLSTLSLSWYWLHRIFLFAKKSWYTGLDLFFTNSNYDYWDTNYLKDLINNMDLPILSITVAQRWLKSKQIEHISKVALELWIQNITFYPAHFSDTNSSKYLEDIAYIKKTTNLSISIQNVESNFIFWLIPEFKNSTLYEIKKVTWNTALDLSNIDSSTWIDIMKAQKILWNSIKNVYFSDRYWSKKGLLPWKAWWWTSHLPLESFLMKLRTTGYNSFITLKVSPKEMGVWTEDIVLQNLLYFKDYYNKHFLNYKN